MLYKYPQREFPYRRLQEENRRRTRNEPEFELLDTGVFDDDRYFDVFVEYAKAAPDDILMLVTIANRGPDEAAIHVLAQLWFRNTWSWDGALARKPALSATQEGAIEAVHRRLGQYLLHAEGRPKLLFCENETNLPRLYGANGSGYFKDGFHDYVVQGNPAAVNPLQTGTKAAAYYRLTVPGNGTVRVRLRLTAGQCPARRSTTDAHPDEPARGALPARLDAPMADRPFTGFEELIIARRGEADEFYADLQKNLADPDARRVQRQALAGMIWNKQFYHYDVSRWLKGDPAQPPPPPQRRHGRNHEWTHLNSADVMSMPDKWEYPWFAAWDLAFHSIVWALVDARFAKSQLVLLAREWYMHPNGQLPAYEFDFGDVNPPVHAWAAWRVFQIDRKRRGDQGDLAFLERMFHKLMLNFTWWVNRKDVQGRNIFQGGFLGLDNIGVFDRDAPLPNGEQLDQADATSWMAMYCLNLMRIALELALHNHVYEDIATKFFEHFLGIAEAMTNLGESGAGLWDEEDEFFYDKLQRSDGRMIPLKVRSMVGLAPLFAVETLEPAMLASLPDFNRRLKWYLQYRPDLAALVSRWHEPGLGERRLLSLLRGHRMKRLLKRMLDPSEFFSEYGVRALSRYHLDHPYTFSCNGTTFSVKYLPAESDSGLFGGNSNWRGPIWLPVNYLIIESLQKFHHYYGDDFHIECPTGSGQYTTIQGVAQELSRRLARIFLRGADGRRPCFGDHPKLQDAPHFRDYLLFHEYFHGDLGHGMGASHQTGWTGLIAKLLQPRPEEHGRRQPREGAQPAAAALP